MSFLFTFLNMAQFILTPEKPEFPSGLKYTDTCKAAASDRHSVHGQVCHIHFLSDKWSGISLSVSLLVLGSVGFRPTAYHYNVSHFL